MPQIDLTTGGTFVSMAFATSVSARARVQLGVKPPKLDGAGFPFFAPGDKVASVVTDGPKLLQQASLIDSRTGQKLFFVIFCWDASGSWDLVWNTTGVAPATPPELITTKDRMVEVRLHRLRCLSDSDDLSDGEATFKFIVRDDTPTPQTKTVSWDPMPTGGSKLIFVGTATFTVNPPNAANGVSVRIEGVEDDSGSFPPDDDDTAAVGGLVGSVSLPFPVGEKLEEVNDSLLTLYSEQTSFGEKLSFIAEVVYSVKYI
jgi:hypothetical protein